MSDLEPLEMYAPLTLSEFLTDQLAQSPDLCDGLVAGSPAALKEYFELVPGVRVESIKTRVITKERTVNRTKFL